MQRDVRIKWLMEKKRTAAAKLLHIKYGLCSFFFSLVRLTVCVVLLQEMFFNFFSFVQFTQRR